jgi:hypothetical protein
MNRHEAILSTFGRTLLSLEGDKKRAFPRKEGEMEEASLGARLFHYPELTNLRTRKGCAVALLFIPRLIGFMLRATTL